jgi:hypothetical protein
MAAQLEATLAQGVKDGKIPHAIVHATNKDGTNPLEAPEWENHQLTAVQVVFNTTMLQDTRTTALTRNPSPKTQSSNSHP